MAFPPDFMDELRQRLTLSDIVGRKVTWDRRKSNPAKGDYWAPCPFHQEKTASFHADDRKGFYYCFGCHEKGDMFGFVMATENLSFPEAVERLAGEAGIEMPAQTRDPQAAAKRDRLGRLADVMEQAVRLFRLTYGGAAGTAVRHYVTGRGLSEETVTRFELGFAPESRTHLTRTFTEKGLLQEAVDCGLIIRPDDGGQPYDRFRNRLMFPIRDARGRCIGFGGRAMDPAARAKYLNSPETDLFHKGRTLYNHGPAREAAGADGMLVVAEGYMDVIALAQAGFGFSVAPLGTAITEEQLGLLWRMADEPVIALDGDKAGLRAAHRLIDVALPMLAPGKSLRFCLMPEGRDPDDLIRAEGHGAMQAALEGAIPLIELFWRRETDGATLDTPERRAAFDATLRAALEKIADKSVRDHYAADLRERRRALFQPKRTAPFGVPRGRGSRQNGRKWGQPAAATPAALASDLARSGLGGSAQARIREAGILLIALRHSEAAREAESSLERMTCTVPEFDRIRDALLDRIVGGTLGDGPGAEAALGAVPQARTHPMAQPGAPHDRVVEEITQAVANHEAQLGFEAELAAARQDLGGEADDGWSARLRQAMAERERTISEAGRLGKTEEEADDYPAARLLQEGGWRRHREGGKKK